MNKSQQKTGTTEEEKLINIESVCTDEGKSVLEILDKKPKGEIIKIPFINEEFKLKEQITCHNINRIYADIPKTLRLVVSLGSKCFDMNGVATPLVAQLRTTISKIMQTTDGWDGRIAPEQWNFFCKTTDRTQQGLSI